MIIYSLSLDNNKTIKLWNISNKEVVAQMFDNGNKSRKSTYKIKHYNNRAYITMLGHRYYLENFTRIDL